MFKFFFIFILMSSLSTPLLAKEDVKSKPQKSVENWYRNQTRRPASLVETDFYVLNSEDFQYSPTHESSIHKQYTCSTIASGQGIPESSLEPKQTKRTFK